MSDTTRIAEYHAAVLTCILARDLLRQHDLQGMLDAIGRAESFGPVLDPTLYRDKAMAMAEDRDLMRAALALRDFEIRTTKTEVSNG